MSWRANDTQICGPAWYCARTQPKHEHIAARTLSANLGLEVFHPRLKLERATCRGPVRVIEPVFPCYVFVRGRPEDDLDRVRYVNGVRGLVQFGQRIPVVPDGVIEELRQCFDLEEQMVVEDRLAVGTEVTVAKGALLGSRGRVARVLPARRRVQILLDFLGQTTLAEVERGALLVENRSLADLVPALAAVQTETSLAGAI